MPEAYLYMIESIEAKVDKNLFMNDLTACTSSQSLYITPPPGTLGREIRPFPFQFKHQNAPPFDMIARQCIEKYV